ncbi:carbonic anhydrase 13 [Xenopus tropicalis]|uniref:Carbonic anhydrase n=1 Tax=Xenopus tropicalis TaxID=8364 RepID=Q0V985_XENTR|eukprot:NP_001072448.1 carbonic anhydrase 13 [Xenopus tropicalis]
MMHQWGYEDHNGPEVWHDLFPLANGDRQSPINIITRDAIYDPSLQPLQVNYDHDSAKVVINTGHTFTMEFDDGDDTSVLRGGPFIGSYRLRQFHFHWGSSDGHGSEHKVDGMDYAAELHIVHWNSEKFSSFVEAACAPDGLAVLGVFLKIGEPNRYIERITDTFGAIRSKGKQSPFTNFDPSCLLPASMDFWTYPGSLTVPPLLESVTWVVLKEPISISHEQLARFRSLLFTKDTAEIEACCMKSNHRPVQPLKNRKVRASFL